MAISCSNCGKELPDAAKFCAGCGSQVAAPEEKAELRFCAKCGVQLLDDAKFCLECGTPVTEDETPWFQKKDEAFETEMYKSSPLFIDVRRVLDFEETKYKIQHRAREWAEYNAKRMSAPEWFGLLYTGRTRSISLAYLLEPSLEYHYFPTNKRNTHEALVQRTMLEWFFNESLRRGYLLDYEGHFSPKVLAYYKAQDWYRDDGSIEDYRFEFDLSYLDELEKKDARVPTVDELFPPPQPIRAEVAGAVLNFTTDEGALVVYMDCSYAGKIVEVISCSEYDVYSALKDADRRKAEIIEHSVNNTTACAAIFNRIPFVTPQLKSYQKVLQRIEATLVFYFSGGRTEEKVTIFRGNITELDWRGKK